jgi:hypothetical protein
MENPSSGQSVQNVPDNSSIKMRNDILKLLYGGMLLELPQSQVREFWARHPQPDDPDHDGENLLFRNIWQEKKCSSLDYVIEVLNDVEPFFISHNLDTVSFIRKTFLRIHKGMLISAKSILRWGKPFLSYFYIESDPRPLILRIIDYFSEQLASGIVHKLVQSELDGVYNSATLLVMYSEPIKPMQLQKKTFVKDFPPYDCELWTAMLVQSIPLCMQMMPFEQLNMVSDCRTIEQILPGIPIHVEADKVIIDGKDFGTIMSFKSFCDKKGINLTRYKIPPRQVIQVSHDFFCPNRKRNVLHADCAYSAPVYLYNFKYRKGVKKPEDFMAMIIDDAVGDVCDSWAVVKEIHENLLEQLSFKADIIYFNEEESISINGKHIIKSTPAKIFRKMLVEYVKSGKTVFEHREFIRDESIILDPNNPNLNVRLQRLVKAMEDNFPKIRISRSARGKIVLVTDCKICYREE